MSNSENPRGDRRRRRSAEEAQREILDAAQQRLNEGGPDAIRLQDIARDVGVSHPAILHHFGSREGLIRALDERAIFALTDDVAKMLELSASRGVTAVELVERVAVAMDQQGLARLIAWWAMRGPTEPDESTQRVDPAQLIDSVAEQIHRRLDDVEGIPPDATTTLEQVRFGIRLAVVAMFGDAIIGDQLSGSPPDEREAERHRFREWVAELLVSRTQPDDAPADGDDGADDDESA